MVKTQDIDSDVLNEYIRDSGIKIGRIVEALGISRQAFHKKRYGEIAFRASEVYVLCDLLKIPDEMRSKIFCV